MSATLKAPRNLQFPAPRAALVEWIGGALRRAYEQRGAAKAIARAAEGDSRTVEAWLYGATAPRSPELVRLMADNDSLELEIYALVREIRERKNCPSVPSPSPSGAPSPAPSPAPRPQCNLVP